MSKNLQTSFWKSCFPSPQALFHQPVSFPRLVSKQLPNSPSQTLFLAKLVPDRWPVCQQVSFEKPLQQVPNIFLLLP